MDDPYREIRLAVLDAALPNAAFDGWTAEVLRAAVAAADIDNDMAVLAFPDGVSDLIAAFSARGDDLMAEALADVDAATLKIRDRIRRGVIARIEADVPHRIAARRAAAAMALPPRQIKGGRLTFATAHRIWRWAGDTDTDWNFYSKRLILSGVIASTRLRWFTDDADDFAATKDFLDRRIGDVMRFEKFKAETRKTRETWRARFC